MIVQGDFEDNSLEPVAGTGAPNQITAAAGAAPATGGYSPADVRALLTGISKPPAPETEVGAVHLASSDRVLPGVIARAANSGTPFSLVVARPGPAASPGHPAGTPSAGQVADLAAALSVSVGPSQELLQAGTHHLAVVIPGNTGTGRRQALQLMQRAAGAGAPLFTWAAARYPRDATTADRLVEVGRRRVDGFEVGAGHPAAAAAGSGSRRRAGAVWAGVAAAALVAALAFGLHGSGGPARPGSGANTPATGGQAGTTSSSGHSGGTVGGSATLSSGEGSTFPGHSGSVGSSSGSGGTTGTGTSAGSGDTGSGGAQQANPPSGSGSGTGSGTQGSGGSSSSGTNTNTGGGNTGSGSGTGGDPGVVGGLTSGLGNTVGGVLGTTTGSTGSGITSTSGTSGAGTTGTGSTTGTTGTGTGTNPCSGLLNTLTCTVNGVLGG